MGPWGSSLACGVGLLDAGQLMGTWACHEHTHVCKATRLTAQHRTVRHKTTLDLPWTRLPSRGRAHTSPGASHPRGYPHSGAPYSLGCPSPQEHPGSPGHPPRLSPSPGVSPTAGCPTSLGNPSRLSPIPLSSPLRGQPYSPGHLHALGVPLPLGAPLPWGAPPQGPAPHSTFSLGLHQVQHLAQAVLEGQGLDGHAVQPPALLLVEVLQLKHGQHPVPVQVHAAEPVLNAAAGRVTRPPRPALTRVTPPLGPVLDPAARRVTRPPGHRPPKPAPTRVILPPGPVLKAAARRVTRPPGQPSTQTHSHQD